MKKHHHYFLWAFIFLGIGFIANCFINSEFHMDDLKAFISGEKNSGYEEMLHQLEEQKEKLSEKIEKLQNEIEQKKAGGEAKLEEIQSLLAETRENYEQTKKAIQQLHESFKKWGEVWDEPEKNES